MEIAMSHGFAGRREDHRLVTGRGYFTADWNLPGQAYGCFLRSDRRAIRLLLQKQGFIFQAIPNYRQIGMTITYCCVMGFS
jgi:hypothetical protein